jgi:hypothetical protein
MAIVGDCHPVDRGSNIPAAVGIEKQADKDPGEAVPYKDSLPETYSTETDRL